MSPYEITPEEDEDWEPTEEQLLSLTPLAQYQRQTEFLVRQWEKENKR